MDTTAAAEEPEQLLAALMGLEPSEIGSAVHGLPPEVAEAILRQLDQHTTPAIDTWICDRDQCDGAPHDRWTEPHARTSQREPDSYETWAIVTGRGWGKSRTGSETVKRWAQTHPDQHVAVIGKTDRETRNICFEGPAGLLNVIPHDQVGRYGRSGGDTVLTLRNGSVFRGFSAERPETLRGYAFTGAWADEYASWAPRSAEDCWDNLWFALREAEQPRVIVTTTPRNLPHMKAILESADHITRGHTAENSANLSEAALRTLEARYNGTRIGRQELAGELLEDVEGALWTPDDLERSRIDTPPDLVKTVVGVDPPSGPGTCGIVVVGLGRDRNLYVLADYSMTDVQPSQWADAVATAAKDHGALVVAEINQGGRMVREVLQQADRMLPVTTVNAAQGKQARAEPVALLWEAEAQTAHMVGRDAVDLEDQMTGWVPGTFSPDRVDALVWACTYLMGKAGHRGHLSVPGRMAGPVRRGLGGNSTRTGYRGSVVRR